jgi:hypothetical protein
VSLGRIAGRYVWDKRPGYYFIEWWEDKQSHWQLAGQTPSEAAEAQRRKQNELIGELLSGNTRLSLPEEGTATPISDAIPMFTDDVRAHSPDKPKTVLRYPKVLQHFERHLGKRKYVEAVTRADIDDFKIGCAALDY